MSKRTKIIIGLILGSLAIILAIKFIFFGSSTKRVASNERTVCKCSDGSEHSGVATGNCSKACQGLI